MSEMTSEQLARGIVILAQSMQSASHVTPKLVEEALGGPLEFGTAESQLFGKVGDLAEGGRYEAVTVPFTGLPKRFDIEFKPTDNDGDASCVQTIGRYHGLLIDAGFTPSWIAPPRLGSRGRWHYRDGDVDVSAFLEVNAVEDAVHACVVRFAISMNR